MGSTVAFRTVMPMTVPLLGTVDGEVGELPHAALIPMTRSAHGSWFGFMNVACAIRSRTARLLFHLFRDVATPSRSRSRG
jgi:hypothetical protein